MMSQSDVKGAEHLGGFNEFPMSLTGANKALILDFHYVAVDISTYDHVVSVYFCKESLQFTAVPVWKARIYMYGGYSPTGSVAPVICLK